MYTLPFQQQFTWRKLGYLTYGNSLDYRAVLELNPQWNVTEDPPVGAQIVLPPPGNTGAGGLQQSPFLYGVDGPGQLEAIYPFNTFAEYTEALGRYSVAAVEKREAVNGYSSDSVSAFTGIQG